MFPENNFKDQDAIQAFRWSLSEIKGQIWTVLLNIDLCEGCICINVNDGPYSGDASPHY